MIKNIVLDVGGVLFDDGKENRRKLVGYDKDDVMKRIYSEEFMNRMRGTQTLEGHMALLQDDPDFDIIYTLMREDYLPYTYPVMPENLEYVRGLKEQGYKLFLLTNTTEESHRYIDAVMDINSLFDGGIYSYLENILKPDAEIYRRLVERYGLKKEETIFFDDREKNVIAARKFGIQAEVFKTIDNIKQALERDSGVVEKQ